MRNITINDATYLGPYSPILNVGDVQSMILHSTHPGQWKTTSAEINKNRRNDKVLVGAVGKEQEKTVAQLMKAFKIKQVCTPYIFAHSKHI
jgi:hypothetical protein